MNTLIILLGLLSSSPLNAKEFCLTDTGLQVHRHDGILNEWPGQKFVTDQKSGIEYAVDNDKGNIYVAMKIKDPFEQLQMMHFGMRLFIDLKGKQKENHAIEFPLRNEKVSAMRAGKVKEQRMFYAANLIALRLIGFPEPEPLEQDLELPGSAQIAYTWDSADFMYVEYLLPNTLFISPGKELNKISLGWKIYGPESTEKLGVIKVPQGMTSSTTNAEVYENSVGSSSAAAEQIRAEQERATKQTSTQKRKNMLDRVIKEHMIWTNYTLRF